MNMGFDNTTFRLTFLVCLLLTSFLFGVKAIDNVESGRTTTDHGPSFSYDITADDGPLNWGNLDPAWKLCGDGRSQTPINIATHNVVPVRGDLIKSYKAAPAVIRREVHEVMVEWMGDAGGIVINGEEYKLAQCHWHTPTEHLFNRIRHDVELHLVHKNDQGDIAVVGILYEMGWTPDPFLTWLLPYVTRGVSELGYVDPFWIGLGDTGYYRYNGSLTTPPCSENVKWTLFKAVRTVSPWQIRTLRNAIQDGYIGNARPLQRLNGRTVYSFEQTISSI